MYQKLILIKFLNFLIKINSLIEIFMPIEVLSNSSSIKNESNFMGTYHA